MGTRVLMTAALTVLAAAACGGRRPVIGVVLPETGAASVYGASIKSGVQLAFAGLEASPTTTIAIEFRDSASDPTRAAGAAEALYRAGALLVIGGATTAEARAILPMAEKYERLLLSPSASAPELTRRSPFVARVYPSDEVEGVAAADFLARLDGSEAILIVQEDNDYTRGLLPIFLAELANRGGRVAAVLRTDEGGWEDRLRRALARGQTAGVYVCGYGDAILAALMAIDEAGFEGVVCTTSAINAAPFLRRAGALAEGVVFPLAGLDLGTREEPARTFIRRYHETYDLFPDTYAAHGYDAALVAIAVFEGERPRSGAEVRRRLHALRDRRGVMGELAFDERGNVQLELRLHEVLHGKVQPCGRCTAGGGHVASPVEVTR
jgi:branched-chain amino acid transport system substrate-binding protein